MSAEKSLRQIKMSEEQHEQLKTLAFVEKHYLYEICNEALQLFIEFRKEIKRSNVPGINQYLASPRIGNYQSYWLNSATLKGIRDICAEDIVSESRVIYTAFVHYLHGDDQREKLVAANLQTNVG